MDFSVLKQILTTELSATQDADALVVEHRVTLMVDVGGDSPVSLARVRRVRHAGHYVEIETDDGRLFVAEDAVVGVRAEKSQEIKDSRPGFH